MAFTISERIDQIINDLDLSKNQFAKQIGTSSALISQITSGKDTFRIDLAQKIISTFPSLNANWLLSGIGEMWIGTKPEKHTKRHTSEHTEKIRDTDNQPVTSKETDINDKVKIYQKLYKKLVRHLGYKAQELEDIDTIIDNFSDLTERISTFLENHLSLGAGVSLIQKRMDAGDNFEKVVNDYLAIRSNYDKATPIIKNINDLLLKYIADLKKYDDQSLLDTESQDISLWYKRLKERGF